MGRLKKNGEYLAKGLLPWRARQAPYCIRRKSLATIVGLPGLRRSHHDSHPKKSDHQGGPIGPDMIAGRERLAIMVGPPGPKRAHHDSPSRKSCYPGGHGAPIVVARRKNLAMTVGPFGSQQGHRRSPSKKPCYYVGHIELTTLGACKSFPTMMGKSKESTTIACRRSLAPMMGPSGPSQ